MTSVTSRVSPLGGALRGLALVGLTAAAWALSAPLSQARAGDVYWSVGVHGPGVSVGAGNAPVIVHRPPQYVYPAPVWVYPPPVYVYHPPLLIGSRPAVAQGWISRPRWEDRRDRRDHRWHDRRDHRDRDDDRRGHRHRDHDGDDDRWGYGRR